MPRSSVHVVDDQVDAREMRGVPLIDHAPTPFEGATLAELKGHAAALREQAIALWSAVTRPSTHEGLAHLVADIVDEIELLKRLDSDAVPLGTKAELAALGTRLAGFESVLRSSGPNGDNEAAVQQADPPRPALKARTAGSR